MDVSPDLYVTVSALVFTVLALVVTTKLFRKTGLFTSTSSAKKCNVPKIENTLDVSAETIYPCRSQHIERDGVSAGIEQEQERVVDTSTTYQRVDQTTVRQDGSSEHKSDDKCKSDTTISGPVPDHSASATIQEGTQRVASGVGSMDKSLRYVPGMCRTSHLEKMMTKEELEEEQRVQREQLAAIFQLLKDNQDTFGEVTEKDMEEQLKLYSI